MRFDDKTIAILLSNLQSSDKKILKELYVVGSLKLSMEDVKLATGLTTNDTRRSLDRLLGAMFVTSVERSRTHNFTLTENGIRAIELAKNNAMKKKIRK